MFWKRRSFSAFDASTTRERLIQGGRIVVIDDETPLLISELKRAGLSVDHDREGSDLGKFDNQLYDVAIVDYHGVGRRLGAAQGLELLRYIRRVSPGTRLIAYTSRSLTAAESEFFRLSHVVLPKDLGLADSLSLIESELRKAFSKEHLFDALVMRLNMTEHADKGRMQQVLVKALAGRDEDKFKKYLARVAGQAAEKTVEMIVAKLF
jgi:hypothetical protein